MSLLAIVELSDVMVGKNFVPCRLGFQKLDVGAPFCMSLNQ